jgi:hypothetical protein
MTPRVRLLAVAMFASLVLLTTGCNSNAKKLAGKWKVTSVGGENVAEKEKAGITLILEFKSDGTGSAAIEATDAKAQEFVKKLNEKAPKFNWSVSGDTLELTKVKGEGEGEGLFGKKEKGKYKLKFEGETLTLTPEEKDNKPVTLTRVK